jgi:hypothetical protein
MKQLEEGSTYAHLDVNNDGIVSDAELLAAERVAELEAKIERWRNQDALEDRQRMIALIAMLSCIFIVFWLLTPFVSIERIDATNALVNLFLTFNTGVVIGFMGLSALGRIKGNKE